MSEGASNQDKSPKVDGPAARRVMSGIRVTGQLHIGHYWGALRNWLELQEQYECYFGAMDWHGMTSAYKGAGDLDLWTREMIADLVAWGIDPERSTIFIQSRVPEHLELMIIFANLTPMGWLERVPTWKDAEEEMRQSDTRNLGRFSYPVLQAADVAIYRGELVPVGGDQVAHLELSREIVRRYNFLYKGKLPEPQPLLTDTPAVPGLDGRKMSKSYGNALALTLDEKPLRKRVGAMVTDPQRVRREDPGEPTKCPVYGFHQLYSSKEDLAWVEQGCRSAGIGCGDCKGKLTENINRLSEKPRERKKELLNNPDLLDSIILSGCDRARQEAARTLTRVRKEMKFYSGIKK